MASQRRLDRRRGLSYHGLTAIFAAQPRLTLVAGPVLISLWTMARTTVARAFRARSLQSC